MKNGERIILLENRLETLETKVKQLECNHNIESRDFIDYSNIFWSNPSYYQECFECGKILEYYEDEKAYNEAVKEWHKECIKEAKS